MDDTTMSESDWVEGDDEEEIEDIEDVDEAFFEEIIPNSQIKKSYQVVWKTYSTAHITQQQEAESSHVANILGCPKQHAATLLRHYKWKKDSLVEKFMDNPQKVLKEAGVKLETEKPILNVIKGFCCDICCNDTPGLLSLSLDCNHRFCKDCWSQYVTGKIVGEGESRSIQCPGNNCALIVDGSTVRSVVDDSVFKKYETLLVRTYVDDHKTIKWCPAPNCEFAIECSDITPPNTAQTVIPTVTCNCGHTFCFQCGLDAHLPCICELTKLWLKKCKDDSETSNWLSANTKECVKCNTSIEKNGGCNHMTCRKCKHEFCWVCMGEWSIHGSSWYQCNKYDEKEGVEARDSEAKSRAALNRYLHYYTRYTNHEQSAKLDKELYEKTEKKMKTILDNTTELSWIQVQFLKEAVEILLSARKTLQYTYAFAYYLLKDENSTIIFEQNQRDLEMVVEQLSELLEKPFIVDGGETGDGKGKMNILEMKQDIMNKSAYVISRREILLKDCCDGLLEKRWKYNVQIE